MGLYMSKLCNTLGHKLLLERHRYVLGKEVERGNSTTFHAATVMRCKRCGQEFLKYEYLDEVLEMMERGSPVRDEVDFVDEVLLRVREDILKDEQEAHRVWKEYWGFEFEGNVSRGELQPNGANFPLPSYIYYRRDFKHPIYYVKTQAFLHLDGFYLEDKRWVRTYSDLLDNMEVT